MKLNALWLKPYAAFCFLRDLFGSADHRQWGLMHDNSHQHTERLTAPDQPFHRDMCYTYWLQWHLHKQLLEAADYARSQRVVLKGDLPIGVAKSSADTWYSPQLFRMDVSVGSPPDAFDAKGQNWGFPGVRFVSLSVCAQYQFGPPAHDSRACSQPAAVCSSTLIMVRWYQHCVMILVEHPCFIPQPALLRQVSDLTSLGCVQGITGMKCQRMDICGGGNG